MYMYMYMYMDMYVYMYIYIYILVAELPRGEGPALAVQRPGRDASGDPCNKQLD